MKRVLLIFAAVALGLGSGYLYFALGDIMILALLALALSMALGAADADRPWLWALLLAGAMPAAALFVQLRGLPVLSGQVESALVAALASTFLGAYAGAMLRRMVTKIFGH